MMQEAKEENCEIFNGSQGWCDINSGNIFNSCYTYRLRADYEPEKPEPEVVECEVWLDTDCLVINRNDSVRRLPIVKAMSDPTFIDYKYVDGTTSLSPRRKSKIEGMPAEIPTHVLFAKGI